MRVKENILMSVAFSVWLLAVVANITFLHIVVTTFVNILF